MGKAKTHEEYVSDLLKANPNIEVIEQYSGANTPILHKCKLDNCVWKIAPGNMLHRKTCPKCTKKYHRTHDDYVEELKIINPNIEVVGKYINARTKIAHKCLIHNIIWDASPSTLLQHGGGCKKCGGEKIGKSLSKTHEQYVSELYVINSNIEVLEEYQGASTPIKHKCKVDGYEWFVTPANTLSQKGCPRCVGRNVDQDEYIRKLSIKSPNVIPLQNYTKATNKMLHKCLVCDYEWYVTPTSLLSGNGCPECGKKIISQKLSKTHEQYVNELKEYNPNVEVIELYINALTPIKHKCKIDGHEWKAAPAHLLRDTGCPVCSNSKGEAKVRKWLDEHNIIYETEKRFRGCKDKKTLPFDFYLPNHNVCIEYDGEQHYKPVNFCGINKELSNKHFESTKKHDAIKNEYCKNNGIRLIRIPYYQDVNEQLDLLLT